RTENFVGLLWNRTGQDFELAIEANLPETVRERLILETVSTIRYEVSIGVPLESDTEEIGILSERVFLTPRREEEESARVLFPGPVEPPETIRHKQAKGWKLVVSKNYGGNDNFTPENKTKTKKAWSHSFKLGPRKSALGNLPPDEDQFPACTWLKS